MANPKVHAICTGLVQVRRAQMESQGTGIARTAHMLVGEDWSDWLPIYAWVIEHDEGIIVVDTGETARVHDRGYHPAWHPFYRRAVHFAVQPGEEIGPQLRGLGITPRDIRHLVLTHLHTDHAGGLAHFTGCNSWVDPQEFKRASGFSGKLQGYLPHRWPKWWRPNFIRWEDRVVGPFAKTMPLTKRGDVCVVPTPGHTPNHVSVLVGDSPALFLAGDTSYNQALLIAGKVDGVSPDMAVSKLTLGRIRALAQERPLVYLPSHDPESIMRLRHQGILEIEACVA
ncbi:MAG: N-acyl homoserine lactonase family protein [Acidobacteriaceae bacterium]